MSTNYPGSLDTSSQLKNDAVDDTPTITVHAQQHDNVADALIAVEAELGVNPSGTFSTVVARLNATASLTPAAEQTIQPTSDLVTLIFKLFNSGSTADFWEAKTSAGAIVAYLNKSGELSASALRISGVLLASTHLSDTAALARLANPTFTGTPAAPTPSSGDNTTKIATTAFVKAQSYATLADVSGVGYALLNSPALTGTPTAPTPAPADNSTKIATTAYVDNAVSGGSGFSVGDFKDSAQAANHGSWLLCDGTAVSRTTYSALFALIGTAHGTGNGTTTFNLPDFRGRVSVAKGSHADTDSFGDNDGTSLANRTPKHNSTNSLTATATLPPNAGVPGGSGSHVMNDSGSGGQALAITVAGTIGPGGTRPIDTPAYLVAANVFIHI